MTERIGYMFDDIDLAPVMDLLKNHDISGWYKNNNGGDALQFFQRCFAEYCGTKHAFGVSSGSASIYIALKACGVGRGDNVIVPSYTHVGSVAPIILAGAKPVFVDVDQYGNLDPNQLGNFIYAKALIAVHQLGQPCDMSAIKKNFSGWIIEDASHALGSEYYGKRCGSLGNIGCFSVGGGRTKAITTAEGGMITTNDDNLAEKCKNIRNHGDRITDCNYFCFNFRLSELNALLGVLQMPKLAERIEWQIRNANYIIEHLPDYLEVLKPPAYANTNRYIIGCFFQSEKAGMTRNEFVNRMIEQKWDGGMPRMNIGSGYGKLIHEIKFYRRYIGKPLPISEQIRDNAIWIDWARYPRTKEEIDVMLDHLSEIVKNKTKLV